MQLVENALRDDLRPVEQAKAYRALMDLNGWMAKDLAAELAIDKGSVSRALSLLELPEAVQETVDQGTLAPSAAAEIARLPDPEVQEAVAEEVVKEGLKRDEVVKLVQAVKSRRSVPPPKPEPLSLDLGDCTVTVRWKRASGTTAAEALERALAAVRQQEHVA
jgi:ParB family chromosome partitioning protein